MLIKTKANVIGARLEELMELIQVRNFAFSAILHSDCESRVKLTQKSVEFIQNLSNF